MTPNILSERKKYLNAVLLSQKRVISLGKSVKSDSFPTLKVSLAYHPVPVNANLSFTLSPFFRSHSYEAYQKDTLPQFLNTILCAPVHALISFSDLL